MWSVPGWELTASSQASGNLSQGSSLEFRVQPFRIFQRTLVQVPGQAVHKHLSTPALDGPDASGLL